MPIFEAGDCQSCNFVPMKGSVHSAQSMSRTPSEVHEFFY